MDELKCNVCGSPVNEGDSFCQNCGTPIQTEKQAEPMAEENIQPAEETVTEEKVAAEETPETEETNAGNPFSITEEDTKADVYNQTAPQPQQTGVYNQAAPQPQQTGVYNQTAPQPQQAGVYNQNTYYGQQPVNTQPAEKQKKPGKAAGVVGLIFAILGLLTSACGWAVIPVLFSIVGIVLAIVSLVKGNKGLGISSLIVGGLGFIVGVIMLVVVWAVLLEAGTSLSDLDLDEINDAIEEIMDEDTLEYTPGDYDAVYDSDYDYDDYDDENDFEWINPEVGSFEQIEIDGEAYTIPMNLGDSGITINELSAEDVNTWLADGWEAGDYKFVLLDIGNGSTIFGFLENTTDSTVYSMDELQITGINVDNYSDYCAVTTVQLSNGITFGTSKEYIEEQYGEPSSESSDGAGVYYDSADGNSALYLEYDLDDKVQCIEITVYQD